MCADIGSISQVDEDHLPRLHHGCRSRQPVHRENMVSPHTTSTHLWTVLRGCNHSMTFVPFQDTFSEGGPGGSGVLASVPPALARWTEEARVLDDDSMHDCVTGEFRIDQS